MGFRLWGRTESDTTEATQQQQQNHCLHDYMIPVSHYKSFHTGSLSPASPFPNLLFTLYKNYLSPLGIPCHTFTNDFSLRLE